MRGSICITAKDNGIEVRSQLKGISFFDKAMLIDAFFYGLEIDIHNSDEVATYIAIAEAINKMSGRTKIDVSAIHKMAKQDACDWECGGGEAVEDGGEDEQ